MGRPDPLPAHGQRQGNAAPLRGEIDEGHVEARVESHIEAHAEAHVHALIEENARLRKLVIELSKLIAKQVAVQKEGRQDG
jgi:cell fate (sporulation/competence/biofilm development) regulator YlbF (YheA/YmcA/DUF963 family)